MIVYYLIIWMWKFKFKSLMVSTAAVYSSSKLLKNMPGHVTLKQNIYSHSENLSFKHFCSCSNLFYPLKNMLCIGTLKKVKNLCHACSFSFLEVTYLSRTIKNVPKKVEHQWLWSWHYHIKKKLWDTCHFSIFFSTKEMTRWHLYLFTLITYSDFFYV